MKLHIENFAKISSADIEFDGLTVIAGKNNTGKSTVGKVLYTFFRALSQLPKRIVKDRIDAVVKAFERNVNLTISGEQAQRLLNRSASVPEVFLEVKSLFSKDDPLQALFASLHPDELSEFSKNDIEKTIDSVLSASDKEIAGNLAHQVIDCVFHRQIHPLRPTSGDARLVLTVHGEANEMVFGHGKRSISHRTNFIKKVRLIASPDVLSLLNVRDLLLNREYAKAFEKYTFELAQELARESRLSAAEEEAVRGQIAELLSLLDDVIHGKIVLDDDRDFALLEEGNDRPTKAENLSMGMKFFVLLRLMLMRGVLRERDVLILDEPENHLHPTLQIVYAKVLVVLQRLFNLTILVTSHSAFFVNALQRFSLKELVLGRTHFYLAREDGDALGFVTFDDVTKKTGPIFKEFAEAYALSDKLSGADLPTDNDIA